MIQANYTWEGDRAFAEIKAAGWDGIRRATYYLWQQIQTALNIPNSGEDWPIEGKKGKTRRAYPNSSRPGEPPRKITGFGAANVSYSLDQAKMIGKVGVMKGGSYMIDLELGTRAERTITAKAGKALMIPDRRIKKWVFRKRVTIKPIKPRPWLLATAKRFLPQLKTIVEAK